MDASVTNAAHARPYGVIALIGVGHAISHFYHLAVPVLFPLMKVSLGVSYTELGLLATLFYVASGICQFIAGFLVDHYGARRILFLGLAIVSGAILLCGFAPSYAYLLVLMPLAGIGNSVFHPADFGILNASVKEGWLGKAYGVHTLGGNFGWALAPIVVLGLATVLGWRAALVINDLVRSRQAWVLTWLLTWPFHPILHHDGPLSIRRALTPDELLRLAGVAGVPWLTAERHVGERLELKHHGRLFAGLAELLRVRCVGILELLLGHLAEVLVRSTQPRVLVQHGDLRVDELLVC